MVALWGSEERESGSLVFIERFLLSFHAEATFFFFSLLSLSSVLIRVVNFDFGLSMGYGVG